MGKPKTINRELGKALANPFLSRVRKVLESSRGGRRILNYHIIPGANAVVTPQGLEAVRDALIAAGVTSDKSDREDAEAELMGLARKTLEAAGIEVVDEVAEVVWQEKRERVSVSNPGEKPSWHLYVDEGDILYIKRCHSKSQ